MSQVGPSGTVESGSCAMAESPNTATTWRVSTESGIAIAAREAVSTRTDESRGMAAAACLGTGGRGAGAGGGVALPPHAAVASTRTSARDSTLMSSPLASRYTRDLRPSHRTNTMDTADNQTGRPCHTTPPVGVPPADNGSGGGGNILLRHDTGTTRRDPTGHEPVASPPVSASR